MWEHCANEFCRKFKPEDELVKTPHGLVCNATCARCAEEQQARRDREEDRMAYLGRNVMGAES